MKEEVLLRMIMMEAELVLLVFGMENICSPVTIIRFINDDYG